MFLQYYYNVYWVNKLKKVALVFMLLTQLLFYVLGFNVGCITVIKGALALTATEEVLTPTVGADSEDQRGSGPRLELVPSGLGGKV